MHHTTTRLLGLLALAATTTTTVQAASHDILVGKSGYVYTPNSTAAAPGDTVVFHFYPGAHNVVQGDFAKPCSTSGGFYSGFIDSASGAAAQTFTVTVNDTNPLWIYCSQAQHCQLGMVMVINPPASGDTLDAYAAAAAKTSTSTTPNSVSGGVVSSGSGPGSSSSAASSGSSSSAAVASSASSSASTAAGGSSASSTPAASSGSQTSASASASATGNAAAPVGRDALLSGLGSVLAAVAFWAGLL